MYDHLDDPAPPPLDDRTRSGVLARAGQLRRKRFALLMSGTSAAVVAVVAAVVAFTGSPDRASLTVVSPTETATAEPTATPTVPPSPRTGPSPTPSPTLSPSPSPALTPTASPTAVVRCQALDCPDGKPGWSNGFTACSPATVAADGAGAPPVDGLVLTLAFPASASGGAEVQGTATVTNNSDVTVSFEVRQPRIGAEAGVAGPGGRSSTHASDALGSEAFDLSPGESDSINVVAHTSSCGDTSSDNETPLSTGSYRLGLTMGYANAQVTSTGSVTKARSYGSWSVAQPLQIT